MQVGELRIDHDLKELSEPEGTKQRAVGYAGLITSYKWSV